MSQTDLHAALGLAPGATLDEIRAAYAGILQTLKQAGGPADVALARLDAARDAFRKLTDSHSAAGKTPQSSPLAAKAADRQTDLREGIAGLKFTGQSGEFFRIWIVNVCLSVLTLGIYSAWAKVRHKRYFYGNTLLNDSAFEYLGDPKAILKGRLVVLGVLGALSLVGHFFHVQMLGLVYLLALPFIVIKAARFNAVNSAHRNVRFRFGGGFQPPAGRYKHFIEGYRETSQFLILPVLLVPLSLGLMYPYYAYRKRQFILEHSAYGTTRFGFDAKPAQYYGAYGKSVLVFVACMVGMVATVGIGILPFYVLFASYRDATIGRLAWRHTTLGEMRFNCRWTTWGLFKLNLVNSLGIIFSLGLLVPWAAIRSARYQLQGLSLEPATALDGFVAAEQQQLGATGDEAGDLLGFDFGL